MIYEAWGYKEDGIADVLANNSSSLKYLIDPGMVLLRTFEVDSPSEAMILHDEANGYEPWIPMDEDQQEYLVALKKLGRTPKEINDQREKHGLKRLGWLDELLAAF